MAHDLPKQESTKMLESWAKSNALKKRSSGVKKHKEQMKRHGENVKAWEADGSHDAIARHRQGGNWRTK